MPDKVRVTFDHKQSGQHLSTRAYEVGDPELMKRIDTVASQGHSNVNIDDADKH